MSISVIIPVYNAEDFISEAVQSCLIQSQISEIILVEDGSEDNSLSICETLSIKNPVVKLFSHPNQVNLGPAHSRNLGISKATGSYISFLDADDLYLPNRFKNAYELMSAKPDIDLVYSIVQNKFDHGISQSKYPNFMGLADSSNQEFKSVLSGTTWISIISVMVKQELIRSVNPMDPNLTVGQDIDFIYNLLSNGNVASDPVQKPKIIRRLHGENRSMVPASIHNKNRAYLFYKWFKKIKINSFSQGEKFWIFRNYMTYHYLNTFPNLPNSKFCRIPLKSILFLKIFFKHPKIMLKLIK